MYDFIAYIAQAPTEVEKTFHSNPPQRTRFAGPPWEVFPFRFSRHPQDRTKEQAAEDRLTFPSPHHKKNFWGFHPKKISLRPDFKELMVLKSILGL
ncbi:MAG: hypothetical protein WBB27_06990 [Maribacter sp.]